MGATVQLLNCGAQIARAFGGRCFSVSCGCHYDFQSVAGYPAPLLQRFLGLLRIFRGRVLEIFLVECLWLEGDQFIFSLLRVCWLVHARLENDRENVTSKPR